MKKSKKHPSGRGREPSTTKKTTPRQPKLNTNGLPPAQAARVAGDIVNNLLARSHAREKPSESDAVVAIARTWLGKAGFHEDPDGTSPERIEIQGPGWEGQSHEHYVDVRVYIPRLDVEHVVDGTHPDGITAEAA